MGNNFSGLYKYNYKYNFIKYWFNNNDTNSTLDNNSIHNKNNLSNNNNIHNTNNNEFINNNNTFTNNNKNLIFYDKIPNKDFYDKIPNKDFYDKISDNNYKLKKYKNNNYQNNYINDNNINGNILRNNSINSSMNSSRSSSRYSSSENKLRFNNDVINTNLLMSNIKTLKFDNLFINASGCYCQYKEDLDKIYSNEICNGSVICKTSTMDSRKGNPEPRYFEDHEHQFTFNSMGLPNMGLIYYLDYFKNKCLALKQKNDTRCKNHFVSLGGLSLEENLNMIDIIYNPENEYYKYIDAIELNFSCPNIPGKCQLGYDFENMEKYLNDILNHIIEKETDILCDNEVYNAFGNPNLNIVDNSSIINKNNINNDSSIINKNIKLNVLQIGIKLPPYFDETHFPNVAHIINKFKLVKYVTCINSIGNGLLFDLNTKKPLIFPKDGLGGIGGEYILPTALANVYKFRKLLRTDIDVIGCGGITSGENAYQHYLAGASFFQVGTHLYKNGPDCISDIEINFNKYL